MQTFKFLTPKRYLISGIAFILGIVLYIFIADILVSSLGRTPSASTIDTVIGFGLIIIILIFIFLFVYSILSTCTFENNRIIFKNGFKTFAIDASEGELLDIYIENAGSLHQYHKNITEEHSFESKGLLENKGLYAPNCWYVVFVSTDTQRDKISCLKPANTDYIAIEYRKELIPIIEKLLPYCKNQRKKENI